MSYWTHLYLGSKNITQSKLIAQNYITNCWKGVATQLTTHDCDNHKVGGNHPFFSSLCEKDNCKENNSFLKKLFNFVGSGCANYWVNHQCGDDKANYNLIKGPSSTKHMGEEGYCREV